MGVDSSSLHFFRKIVGIASGSEAASILSLSIAFITSWGEKSISVKDGRGGEVALKKRYGFVTTFSGIGVLNTDSNWLRSISDV